jgi:hypothetical protein
VLRASEKPHDPRFGMVPVLRICDEVTPLPPVALKWLANA